MSMNRPLLLAVCWCLSIPMFAQVTSSQLDALNKSYDELKEKEKTLLAEIEDVKLNLLRQDLHQNGLPAISIDETIIHHSALSLVYDEEHEQAKWVAHIITKDIRTGNESRSNDFREDPKVVTGSAAEQDYFLKFLQADNSYTYDGYGYDRGHLAPSADFRWSAKALSESYFYSNMSPQAPEFNRGKWAELEGFVRGYLYRNTETQLYVVTGPILKEGLPKVERSVNGLSLPKLYFKAVVDLQNERAIGFIMPNKEILAPIASFAVSLDKIEEETGLDLFASLDDALEDRLESQLNIVDWQPPSEQGDVLPLSAPSLPQNTFNTSQAKIHMDTGREISVCGTVVSTKLSKKGNVFLNLDKKFPNQVFSVTIWKDQLVNFSYLPHEELMGKQICVKGVVKNFNGTPSMNVEREEQIRLYEGE